MLVMGGQACVFYGAAEFSRDLDLLVLADSENLERLQASLEDLSAKPIAVPPMDASHLKNGHAVHFRCGTEGAAGLRIDIMSSLRGTDDFATLWDRRTTIDVNGEPVDLLALEDLVKAKKTQRDKDWPMIRRLMEGDYFSSGEEASEQRVELWLRELRTEELLIAAVARYPGIAERVAPTRSAVSAALAGDSSAVSRALNEEQETERAKDRVYWDPLKKELEKLRRGIRDSSR
jgi:hypothetical protein